MKLKIALVGLVFCGMLGNVYAGGGAEKLRFDRIVSVLGPVEIAPEQKLRVCSTDISVVTQLDFNGREKSRSTRAYSTRKNPGRVVWSSTGVEVFDSKDTLKALPIPIADIIFSSGKGACVELSGREIASVSAAESVMVVLTTLTEAKVVFNPLVSGQLRGANDPQAIGMLLPAVQSGGGGGGGSSSPQSCCACAPVCGCGLCDD